MKTASNTYFENEPKAPPVEADASKNPGRGRIKLPSVAVFSAQKIRQALGWACVVCALYVGIAFLSHLLFSGEADQSVVESGGGRAENNGGYFGAYVANLLITQGFGYVSVLAPPMLALWGFALAENKPKLWLLFWRLLPHFFFWTCLAAMTGGFFNTVFHFNNLDLGGYVGMTLVELAAIYIGNFGVGLALIISLISFGIFKYNLSPDALLSAAPSLGKFNVFGNIFAYLKKKSSKAKTPAFVPPIKKEEEEPEEEIVFTVRKAPPRPIIVPPTVEAPETTSEFSREKKKPIRLNIDAAPLAPPLQRAKVTTPKLTTVLEAEPEEVETPIFITPVFETPPDEEFNLPTFVLDKTDKAQELTFTLEPEPLIVAEKSAPLAPEDLPMEVVVPKAEPAAFNAPVQTVRLEFKIEPPNPAPDDRFVAFTLPELMEESAASPAPEIILDNIIEVEEEKFVKIILPEDVETLEAAEDVGEWEAYDPTRDLYDYKYPTLDLLNQYETATHTKEVDRQELENNKKQIITTLRNYGIEITSIKATIGPTVTLYEIVPAPGIRISKIKNLEDDIALSLAALGIRIIAPMPGKGTIGIEIPNSRPEIVSFRSVIATERFRDTDAALPIAIGRTISNEVFIADLTKMPHLLVAGATGQGKSVGLNCIIASLLYKKHPAQIKFVLIDPKKVEMTLYQLLERHFLAKLPNYDDAIITDNKQVIHVLNSLCLEMDQRYLKLQMARVRNISEYNAKFIARKLNPKKGHAFLPYIVLVIDELADLMMTAGKEIETPIARLAQLARAVGIHLVVATQRPSVNVITGTIKANFPARLSYRVISKIDSRTILDANGAEQLVGRGDLLFFTGSELIRIQNAYIDTPEVEKLVEFIAVQRGFSEPYYLPEIPSENDDARKDEHDEVDRDPLFPEAARLIVGLQQGSTSVIQRRMKLGFNRAGRIMDQLELAGIVGPQQGSKPREVLVKSEAELEYYL